MFRPSRYRPDSDMNLGSPKRHDFGSGTGWCSQCKAVSLNRGCKETNQVVCSSCWEEYLKQRDHLDTTPNKETIDEGASSEEKPAQYCIGTFINDEPDEEPAGEQRETLSSSFLSREASIQTDTSMQTAEQIQNDEVVTLAREPQFRTCSVPVAGGMVIFSAIGGAFGLASGVVVGTAAGILPALLTFGLSIPTSGLLGGIVGLCGGTLVGGASGGIVGFSTYKYRLEIKDGFMTVKVKGQDALMTTKSKIAMVWSIAKGKVEKQVGYRLRSASDAACAAKAKSSAAVHFVTNTKIGVASSAAVTGAVMVGSASGAVGGVVGAAVGIVPAFFTFGMSIPACAVLGMCVGTTVGGTVGAAGGGLAGCGAYSHRKALSEGVHSSWGTISSSAHRLRNKISTCITDTKMPVESSVGESTGGFSDVALAG